MALPSAMTSADIVAAGGDTVARDAAAQAALGGPTTSAGAAVGDLKGLVNPTRRAVITNGGQGDNVAQGSGALTQLGFRTVLMLPVATTRWRLKLRNYNSKTPAAQSALTLLGAVFGSHLRGALGIETGNFSAAPVQVQASGPAMPGDGSFWTGGWITDPALQFVANKEHVLGLAWSAAAGITIQTGVAQNWQFTTASDALDWTKTAGTVRMTLPLDVQIEYESDTARKVGLFVGDSITVGYGGDTARFNTFYQTWPALWAARNNAIAIDIGQAGTTTFDWQKTYTTEDRWTRVDIANMKPDFVNIALGANDASSSATLATYQSYMGVIAANVRALCGDIPVYLTEVTPRSLDATREALRVSYNQWLNQQPLACRGVNPFSRYMSNPADSTALASEFWFARTDNTHYNRNGNNMAAYLAGGVLTR